MSGPKYPLEPLVKLRERQVEGATEKLAKAVEERERAECARLAAEEARVRAEAAARALRDAERDALEKGELRAGDLHRAQAWEIGVKGEEERLAQKVASAEREATRASEQEEGARKNLAAREADAEVVEKDKARFDARNQQRELAKEEEAAAEAWRPRETK
jgi:hypothetical protein